MAFSKAKSRKCPVCLGCMPAKVNEVNTALSPLLADVKATGEIPKPADKRLTLVAHAVGIAPHSLRYHLKECLLDFEIQDQRFQELKDITEALSTAKQEYQANPSMAQATAYTQLLVQWRGLAEDIEGQTDPDVTVEFVVQNVLNPLIRQTLASATEEIKTVRDQLSPMMSANHRGFIDAQLKAALKRITASLENGVNEGVQSLCEYWKVEFESKARLRSLETGKDTTEPLFGPASQSSGNDDVVH